MRSAHLVLLLGLCFWGGEAFAAGGEGGGGSAAHAQADHGKKGGKNDQGKDKKKDKDKKKNKRKDGIQETGIKSFDKVFKEVGAIDGRLASAENQLKSGRQNLNASLGLTRGSPFSDAFTELQNQAEGKLRLGMSGNIPKLEATDAIPSNVQAAVDGFNGFTANLTQSIDDVGHLSGDIQRLVTKCADMPENLVAEFTKGDTASLIEKLFVLPKALKATKHNIDIVTGLDDRVTGLSARMTDLVSLLGDTFEPMPGQKAPGKGGNGARPGGDGKGKGKKGGKKGGGGGGKPNGGGGRPVPGR